MAARKGLYVDSYDSGEVPRASPPSAAVNSKVPLLSIDAQRDHYGSQHDMDFRASRRKIIRSHRIIK